MLDPTVDDILRMMNSGAGGGNLVPAINEMMRLQTTFLKPLVARYNHLTNSNVPPPQQIRQVREKLTALKYPAIICGGSVDAVSLAPRIIGDTDHMAIYVILGMAADKEELDNAWILAYLARAVMKHTISGKCNLSGVEVWNQFVPTGFTLLPAKWQEHIGVTCHFTMDQHGLPDLWPLPPTLPPAAP